MSRPDTPVMHMLKCVDPYYDEVARGNKVHELRQNDRDYRKGDVLWIRHYHPVSREFSNHLSVFREVTYLMEGPWPVATDALKVPCSKCGALPRRINVHAFEGVDCKTWAEGHGESCIAGSWTDAQWISMHDKPGVGPGWCILSMRPTEYRPPLWPMQDRMDWNAYLRDQ